MARAMVAFWRITKNAGTARQRFSSYEASAKKRRSGTWRIISPCNSLTFAPQSAQNLTNSSKSEAGRPLNMPMRRSRSGERFPACPVTRNSPRKTPPPSNPPKPDATDNGRTDGQQRTNLLRPSAPQGVHPATPHTRTHIGNSNKPLGGARPKPPRSDNANKGSSFNCTPRNTTQLQKTGIRGDSH